ncbi:Maf family nucleotide pyrophosphatase [Flavobacteriaceae bacterium]|nr:Maf family nucleotide pyrophosphatase [Flavobacteriaceae bacterium]
MLKKHLKSKNLILASGSPRRQDLLKSLGVPFEIRLKQIDEQYPKELTQSDISDYLAKLKSNAFTEELKPNDVLITSDTIVWHEDVALGKPKTKEDALLMLQKLSGKTHDVITSVCIKSWSKEYIFNSTTKVTFKELSEKEIEFYINNYNPMDKAGAYGIQDWIGQIGVTKIDGSYFNVMGFPIDKIYTQLLKFSKEF